MLLFKIQDKIVFTNVLPASLEYVDNPLNLQIGMLTKSLELKKPTPDLEITWPQHYSVMDIAIDGYEDLNGLYIPEIASQWNCSPFQAMLKLAEESNGAALMLFHTYSGEPGNENVLENVLSRDYCLFETDVLIKASGFPNPAGVGTFPRILGTYVRDKKLFGLENAVHRMTGASAARFGIKGTGTLEKGKAADIVCFDSKTVGYDYDDPSRPPEKPEGIAHVFLNGYQVVKAGVYLDPVKAGRVIRL